MRRRILSGELPPGTRLPGHRELAQLYGVSVGSVREAISMLVSGGLIETQAGRGTYVASSVPAEQGMTFAAPMDRDEIRELTEARDKDMTTDHVGPGSGVGRDYFYFPGDGFGFGYGLAVRTEPGEAKPPPPGSIGELKWDSGSGTYFGVDPKLDMIYILMAQTQNERARTRLVFKKLVYDAFAVGD